jgi:uncharacterized membrane protein YdjX (TVP38/TMEM64 family)
MKNPSPSRHPLRKFLTLPNAIALAVFLLCLAIAIWVVMQSGIDFSEPETLMQSIQALGWRGVLLYIGFLAVAIVIGPIPSTPVTIAAGAVWGAVPAGVYGATGIFLGSIIAFFIGRTLGRSAVQALTGKVLYLSNHRGEAYLGGLVFMMHLIPIMPYELISYGAGISGMPAFTYALTSLLGIIPCTFLLTHMGSAFTVNLPVAIALVMGFLLAIVVLPLGVKRYNWLGLRDVIRVE